MLEKVGVVRELISGLNSGFIELSGSDQIFFSPATEFSNIDFTDLKIGQKVQFSAIETERGLFASKLSKA